MSLLENPYVIIIFSTLVTATVVTMYNRTLEPDESKINRAFFKIAIIGIVSNLALMYFVTRQPPKPAFDPAPVWP
jgi:hypothetical protein